ALELVMVNDRTFAGHDLGDGIGQIAIVLQAQVNLDDLQSAALANNDQIARMRGNGFAAGPGDENKVNGLFQDGVRRHLEKTTVLKERGVEGDERLVFKVGMLGQVRLGRFLLKRIG